MDKNVGIPKPLSRHHLAQKLEEMQEELRNLAVKTIMFREVMVVARNTIVQSRNIPNQNALTILNIKIDTVDAILLGAFNMPVEFVKSVQNKIHSDPGLKRELEAEVKALTSAIVPSTIITPGDRRWN